MEGDGPAVPEDVRAFVLGVEMHVDGATTPADNVNEFLHALGEEEFFGKMEKS